MAITDPGCVRVVTSEETVILVIGRPPSFPPENWTWRRSVSTKTSFLSFLISFCRTTNATRNYKFMYWRADADASYIFLPLDVTAQVIFWVKITYLLPIVR
jgi:hypothetical protein